MSLTTSSLSSLNTEQLAALTKIKELAQSSTTQEFFFSDSVLIRILIARNYEVKDAFEMWQRWVNWRLTFRPECITEQEMTPHIRTGKAFFHGHDKLGRPCLIVRVRFHFPKDFTPEETLRYSIYLAERACEVSDQSGTGQICLIYDRGGITDANQDPNLISLVREMAEVFKDFYAERLGALYVLNVGWVHWLLYHAVRPTIPKKTREKLHVMRNVGGLLEYFDRSQLIREHGGTDDFVPQYPERV